METFVGSDIDDILTTAFEGGINYWCNGVEVIDNDYRGGSYASDVISRGGELELDVDEAEPVRLNKDKLEEGFKLYEDRNEHPFDMSNYDAGDADELVQLAVFREVIYG